MIGIAAMKEFLATGSEIVSKNFTDESFDRQENMYLVSERRWDTAGIADLPTNTIAVCTDDNDEAKVFLVFKLPEGYQSEKYDTAINYMKAQLFDFCCRNPHDIHTFMDFHFTTMYI